MQKRLSVVLVGIGGYGAGYANAMINDANHHDVTFVGVVDPFAESSSAYPGIQTLGTPIFPDLTSFYAQHSADLVVISSPIHLHCPQVCEALKNNSHVLCEKPLAATIEDALKMKSAQEKSGKQVMMGYQWSISPTIIKLKADITKGLYGKPVQFSTMTQWPRDHAYYGRSSWAGAKTDSQGNWILDSPINNATAHYLHNMLFLLGDQVHSAATPLSVEGELYRANDITNFDTGFMRVAMPNDVDLFYCASHAIKETNGPTSTFTFEAGVVIFDPENGYVGTPKGKNPIAYGTPEGSQADKLWEMTDLLRNNCENGCPLDATIPQTICVNALQESSPSITVFPAEIVKQGTTQADTTITWVEGLSETIETCYKEAKLPSELTERPVWAKSGKRIDVSNYKNFSLCDEACQ